MTLDATTRILLEKYDPSNEALRASVSVVKSEALQGQAATIEAPPEFPRKAVAMSNGRTATINIVMSADEYSDAAISAACHKFNAENRQAMSHSYQLPVTYEGIPAGSWVYLEVEEL